MRSSSTDERVSGQKKNKHVLCRNAYLCMPDDDNARMNSVAGPGVTTATRAANALLLSLIARLRVTAQEF